MGSVVTKIGINWLPWCQFSIKDQTPLKPAQEKSNVFMIELISNPDAAIGIEESDKIIINIPIALVTDVSSVMAVGYR